MHEKTGWEFVCRITRGGHRLFADPAGNFAIADDSGFFPHNTDDGVLWIDRRRPMRQEKYHRRVWVPLIDKKGEELVTLTDDVGRDNLLREVPHLTLEK